MNESSIAVTAVDPGDDGAVLRRLLVEFHEWMHEQAAAHDVAAYDVAAELAEDVESLAGEPDSWAWVARAGGEPAGCILLYGETDDLAECRRLWVRPDHRRRGVGRALTRRVAEAARAQGYETLGLTTPPWSEAAQTLYDSLGFERTPPYPETRLPERYHDEAIFMQLDLARGGGGATDG